MRSPEPEPPAPRRARPPGTVKIGSLAGADVLVGASWFLVAALLTVLVAPLVEQEVPGLGPWKYVVGLLYAVAFYLAVLLHEASHAYVARHYGFRVESITLHFLGGMTAVEGEARSPRQEFWIAVVGPLTSIGVGAAAWALLPVLPDRGVLPLVVGGLAFSNLVIGILNLVPGLPLDGGRVLKSAVWRATGNVHRGTIAAGWGGRVAAVAALAWPLFAERLTGNPPDVVTWLVAAVVGVFLWSGATAAMASARLRRRLPSLVARELARRTIAVPADLPLAESVRRAQAEQAGGIVTVTGEGHPVGVVSEAALLAVPEERRPWVPVSSVARTLDHELRLPVDITGEDLIVAIGRRPAEEYLLVEPDGSVYGVLATADVDRAFREK